MPFVRDEKGNVQGYTGAFIFSLNGIEPKKRDVKCVEVLTPLAADNEDLTKLSIHQGNIELWWDGKVCRVILSDEQPDVLISHFKSAYPSAQFIDLEEKEPPWVNEMIDQIKEGATFATFDVEQAHALPFVEWPLEEYGRLIPRLIRSMLNLKYAWIEFKLMPYNWSVLAEYAANNIAKLVKEIEEGVEVTMPHINPVGMVHTMFGAGGNVIEHRREVRPHPLHGSTLHQIGKKLADMALRKGQKPPLILEIHGIAVGTDETVPLITQPFNSVKNDFDFLMPVDYGTPRIMRWLRSRALADPAEQLKIYAQTGCLGGEFGYERELIPSLCLVPEEVPVFIHLPTEPGLPINYTRTSFVPSLHREKKKGIGVFEE